MALFTKTKETNGAASADAVASGVQTAPPEASMSGQSSAECMQIGQLLVDSGQMTPEAHATTLQLVRRTCAAIPAVDAMAISTSPSP